MYAMEANVSKYTNAIGSGKQTITQRQKRKGGRGMREGWEYKKLGEVCDIYQPKTLATEQLVADGKYYVYGANGIIGRYNDYNHEQSEILLTCRGATCGTINISQPYSWINGNAMVIHRKSEDLSFDFLKYLMLSLDYSLIITGAAQPQITRQKIAPIIVKFPSLSVQQSIVSELDKINELISLKKEQLKDYDNLAQSIFYEMFGDPVENEKGWEVKKLIETVVLECTISYGIVQPGDGVEDGIPVVRPIDLTGTFVSTNNLKKTTEKISSSYSRTILTGKELLVCVRGTTGVCSLVTDELKGCNVTRGITPLLFNDNTDRWFMYYQFQMPQIKCIIADYTKGITLKQINMADFRKIPVILPPLPLQQLFAQRIELIEKQKAEVQQTIADLETLLASRMQYWFD